MCRRAISLIRVSLINVQVNSLMLVMKIFIFFYFIFYFFSFLQQWCLKIKQNRQNLRQPWPPARHQAPQQWSPTPKCRCRACKSRAATPQTRRSPRAGRLDTCLDVSLIFSCRFPSTGQLASQFEPLERGLSPKRVETRSNRQLSPQRIDESVTAANDPLLQTLALVWFTWTAYSEWFNFMFWMSGASSMAGAKESACCCQCCCHRQWQSFERFADSFMLFVIWKIIFFGEYLLNIALSTDDLEMRADRHKKRLLAQSMPNGELSDEVCCFWILKKVKLRKLILFFFFFF